MVNWTSFAYFGSGSGGTVILAGPLSADVESNEMDANINIDDNSADISEGLSASVNPVELTASVDQ